MMKATLSTLTLMGVISSQASASTYGGSTPAGLHLPDVAGFQTPIIEPSRGGRAICVSGIVPVKASTNKNIKLNFALPQNQSQVTEAFVEYVTSGGPFMQQIMGGTQEASGTYDIYSTLCVPANNAKPSKVQILTHGVGFDRTYWDFAPGYSYVDVAVEYGYATFSYDRLGVGMSAKADPLNVVQAPLEVEIANSLINMLRSGCFSKNSFSKVVGAGHSFGSIITEAVTAGYPKALDAAILTGFSANQSGIPAFTSALNFAIASQNQPYRFAALNNGYLVSSTTISAQIGFFRAPGFDPKILALAEATKGSVTFGEFFTLGAVIAPAMNFTGPVAVVNGAEDLPFCFGNCSYPINLAQAFLPALYPNVKNTTTYLAPVTGHGLNLHYSATAAYNFIQKFIRSNGL